MLPMIASWITTIGLILDIVGALLVANEIVFFLKELETIDVGDAGRWNGSTRLTIFTHLRTFATYLETLKMTNQLKIMEIFSIGWGFDSKFEFAISKKLFSCRSYLKLGLP